MDDRPATDQTAPIAVTETGRVRGMIRDDCQVFEGIPYAAPPVGPLRWRPPQPVAAWDGVRDATGPGDACLQPNAITGSTIGSEDCLYLNVTTPLSRGRAGGRPVMVWIHGGGWSSGSGADYRGEPLAKTGDVVVVTINYRLGPFGFLAHPALTEGTHLSSDCGIADQQAALAWVRRNIEAFGGDPGDVTIFGESAGAQSVGCHIFSPRSAGLFHKAIIQSGSVLATFPASSFGPQTPAQGLIADRDDAFAAGAAVVKALGLDPSAATAEALRALPAASLLGPITSRRVVKGGSILPLDPAAELAAGRHNRVPVMIGATRDEHTLFVMMGFDLAATMGAPGAAPVSGETYPTLLARAFGDAAVAKIVERYPLSAYPTPGVAFAAVMSDAAWGWPTLRFAQSLAAHGPVWLYQFADETLGTGFITAFTAGMDFPMGVFHGGELPYLFQPSPPAWGAPPLTAPQAELAQAMMGYWTRFAVSGDPNGAGAPPWAALAGDGANALRLAPGPDGLAPLDYEAAHQTAFWRTIA